MSNSGGAYIFTNKGQTLCDLREKLTLFQVPSLMLVSRSEWQSNRESILCNVASSFEGKSVAVRSASEQEDTQFSSNAGAFESVLNILADDHESICRAVATVYGSYEKSDSTDLVIIQEMVADISVAGVVFTHELNTGAPYYVVNYDDASGTTTGVTSGEGEYSNRILYVARKSLHLLRSPRFQKLLYAVQELEAEVGSNCLDIEFAVDFHLNFYLLQVRPISTTSQWSLHLPGIIEIELAVIEKFLRNKWGKSSGILGNRTVFSQMSDWNPVEMIGRAPRALATSLYKTLITDDVWATARNKMGYLAPINSPLLICLGGQPFIDTRLSFQSFLPETINPSTGTKLVDRWVDKLKNDPSLHDKIEFDVAITCFTFDLDQKLVDYNDILDSEEVVHVKDVLRNLTSSFFDNERSTSIPNLFLKLEYLERTLPDGMISSSSGIQRLIDDCRDYGTLPFACLARHAFVARSLLLSLVERGLLTFADLEALNEGVRTVTSDFVDDLARFKRSAITEEVLSSKYGHLRPGTYDILSQRYDQMSGVFSTLAGGLKEEIKCSRSLRLSAKQKLLIDNVIKENGFTELSCDQLIDYYCSAVSGREYGKYVFTKCVSAIIEAVASRGEMMGLDRDLLSHIPIKQFLAVEGNSVAQGLVDNLSRIADENSLKHDVSMAIRLPQVLSDSAGVYVVPFQVNHPNFITSKQVFAATVTVDSYTTPKDLSEKIVLIENADPGYDWIFSYSISGLVTKFGGANSHMAIRCAEFGIPAAIGCGEAKFSKILSAKKVRLDCAAGFVVISE